MKSHRGTWSGLRLGQLQSLSAPKNRGHSFLLSGQTEPGCQRCPENLGAAGEVGVPGAADLRHHLDHLRHQAGAQELPDLPELLGGLGVRAPEVWVQLLAPGTDKKNIDGDWRAFTLNKPPLTFQTNMSA